MTVGRFRLEGGPGLRNAVRRALLSDLEAWAPSECTIRVNTSCQTDEFLAHRIGLVPFRKTGGDVAELTLRAQGPATVTAADLVGGGFEAVHGAQIELMVLADAEQRLDLTVRLERRRAATHARHALCAAVGLDAEGTLVFETLDDRPPREALLEALDAIEARCDAALRQLAHPPREPPRSMC
jgi:DNA-directed RNA polymerase alpha subunit